MKIAIWTCNVEDATESQKNAIFKKTYSKAWPREMNHSDDEVAAAPC